MKYFDEFQNGELAKGLIDGICDVIDREVCLMEVCGTHTVAIFKHGIKRLLPDKIKLLSGPGCPVCVTPTWEVDAAISLAANSEVTLATFGDMMKVPGSKTSLERARADGANIQVVYSSLDALEIAKREKRRDVVFFGIGFETTSPSVASTIHRAKMEGIKNFFVYSCHKLIPPAMRALLDAEEVKIDGFICPGHVSTIIGSTPYEFIPKEYEVPCVISGFEPLDVLHSIYMLCKQIKDGRKCVEIQYRRCVRKEGNRKAQEILYQVFEKAESEWRGLGVIPASGLRIKKEYSLLDATSHFEIKRVEGDGKTACLCGEILRGVATPVDCPLFAKTCTPEQPVGPCMVSTEGTCSAYYKYERWEEKR